MPGSTPLQALFSRSTSVFAVLADIKDSAVAVLSGSQGCWASNSLIPALRGILAASLDQAGLIRHGQHPPPGLGVLAQLQEDPSHVHGGDRLDKKGVRQGLISIQFRFEGLSI